ncbi:RNA polymerase-binding protein DksA [Aquabacterium sp. A7-Y]|uniref:RNA polymerase-binding protein DksA n=1 Tax=Aquabacterium sp. A7-Y TaxID=1349605 RepID=UPI00223E7FA3|nr:RNA polymerase-binding protein DksA [Aquabacterium sp. A7-Y]MCW7537264.1 RNA polymerase-binding protein DksA [Aquabacterium sp. A7-Y]
MSKTPAQRNSSSKPAAKTEPLRAGGDALAPAPKAPAKAGERGAAAVKAPKASAAPAQEPDESESIALSTAPAKSKTAARKAAAEAKASPAVGSEASAAADALSSAPAHAGRATSPTPMSKSSATAVLDQPRPTMPQADPKLANAWKTKSGRDLTDAEVLAMPEAEYMSDKQLEFFRTKLEALKEDLLSNAGETTEHLREDTTIVPDPADRATIEEEHALELRTRDRERKLLKKISQALARIDAGDYGFCDETGEPIGLGRLIARPTATLSLEAQQRRELKQKLFGD